MKLPLLIEQHFHGCYGIDFNTANVDDVLNLALKIKKEGIGYIFPTLVTDSVENIKRQIQIIKTAAEKQTDDMAKIVGVHLEGIFLNSIKKGIHNSDFFLKPTIENYKILEDDFIKIVTLAPELVTKDSDLISYLNEKGVKVQAGHCVGGDLTGCNATTHTFNAMSGISHREKSTALSALVDDNIYTEIIADGVHVSDDALKLLFKAKPKDKILLVSDCLPCTRANAEQNSENNSGEGNVYTFAGSKIYFDGEKATSESGTIAGSTKLLPEIIKILNKKGLFERQFVLNSYVYHNIEPVDEIEWDNEFNIVNCKKLI